MQQKMNIDLSQATDDGCKKCGHLWFRPVIAFKKLSAIISPTGEEVRIPIQAFQCLSCHEIDSPFSE